MTLISVFIGLIIVFFVIKSSGRLERIYSGYMGETEILVKGNFIRIKQKKPIDQGYWIIDFKEPLTIITVLNTLKNLDVHEDFIVFGYSLTNKPSGFYIATSTNIVNLDLREINDILNLLHKRFPDNLIQEQLFSNIKNAVK